MVEVLIVAALLVQAPRCELTLPETVAQGSLVRARTSPGCEVEVDGRRVRVAGDGAFVFGVGRDAKRLTLRAGATTRTIEPAERRWNVERVDGVPPSTVEPPPELAARIRREGEAIGRTRTNDAPREDWRGAFDWAVRGRISGRWGSQRILNGVPKNPHHGLDIAAPQGTVVRAPAPGVVTLAEPAFFLSGGTLVLDHGHGVTSTFIHLSRIDVAVGDRIERGQPIAAVGMTGRATGPHLHWGMNWFDVPVDPESVLP